LVTKELPSITCKTCIRAFEAWKKQGMK
jgi:hypothetical protein